LIASFFFLGLTAILLWLYSVSFLKKLSVAHFTIIQYQFGKFSQKKTMLLIQAPKKKVKKTNVPVAELVYGAMAPVDVQKAVEKEYEMALQDRVMEETKDKKNAVEAYVYDMRNKVRVTFSSSLNQSLTSHTNAYHS
jgi:hypothetical protein